MTYTRKSLALIKGFFTDMREAMDGSLLTASGDPYTPEMVFADYRERGLNTEDFERLCKVMGIEYHKLETSCINN